LLKIKIETCPDNDLIGEHTSFFEDINFGSHKKNDFIIKANGVPDKAISFHCDPKGVFVRTEQIDHFLSNGKKVKGEKIHKPGDKVEFMGTIIEIKEYDNKRVNQKTSRMSLIKNIENLEGPAAEVAKDIKKLLDEND
jgi:hypothetical protein